MKERSEERSGIEEHFAISPSLIGGQLMGPFLSGTGINQKVSGGRWIWAVVLFTDDWLASQNHQIHLPAVTFITVIFKVTATCLVSQHWPPHIYSHLFSPPLFFPLCIRLPLSFCRWVFGQSLSCCFHTPPLFVSPSFNYFYLTFSQSLSNSPTPCWYYTYSLTLLGRLRGSRVREVWRETGETRGREKRK